MVEDAVVLRLSAEIRADRQPLDRHLATIVRCLDEGSWTADTPLLAQASLALHHYYGAAESAFERIAGALEGLPSRSDRWHQDLLRQMSIDVQRVRPAVITPAAYALLRELLQFRHFLRHAYAAEMDPARLRRVAQDAVRLHPLLVADLDRFESVLLAAVA